MFDLGSESGEWRLEWEARGADRGKEKRGGNPRNKVFWQDDPGGKKARRNKSVSTPQV